MLAETYPTSKTNSVLSSRSKSLSIVDKTVLKNAFLLFQTLLSCCKCSCHFELFSSFNTHYYMFALALKFNHFSMFSANRKKNKYQIWVCRKNFISLSRVFCMICSVVAGFPHPEVSLKTWNFKLNSFTSKRCGDPNWNREISLLDLLNSSQ